MASPSVQESQDDWLTLSLSPPSSTSLPPPPPPPSPFQYILLPLSVPSSLPPALPSPPSPHPSPFHYLPLPSPLPQPPQLMYPPHNLEQYFNAPPLPFPFFDSPPYLPSQEHKPVPKDEFPSQGLSFREVRTSHETQASGKARTSSSNPPPRASRESRTSSSNPPRAVRPRRDGKSDTVPPPFPWATSKRAVVYSLDRLRSQGVTSITGTVMCKHCGEQRDIAFNLEEKFNEVARFIAENKFELHDRAPKCWSNPVLPTCERCGTENSLKPVITKKRSINWLFLLLGCLYCLYVYESFFTL